MTAKATLAESIAPQLPHLRRFARALSGSQETGDGYVVAMLESLVADQTLFDKSIDPRISAYKSFLKIWTAVPANHVAETVGDSCDAIADRRIETLTTEPRQAFLLAAVEGLPVSDIAIIMGRGESEINELIDTAGREIAEQIAASVMIIEDEPLIAMDIETLVTDLGHEVVGVATTRSEATAMAAKFRPEIILADIQLADGSSGIDAVNEILATLDLPVVFITAYPEQLLTGERPEPAFLVSKPFRPEMVKAIVSQALFFDVKAGRTRPGAAA